MQNFNNQNGQGQNQGQDNGAGRSGGSYISPSTFIGARIAGSPTYTPAYMMPGAAKPVSAKCEVDVILNMYGKKSVFRITCWGKLADAVARGGAKGKELTIVATPNPYEGRVWVPNPQDPNTRVALTYADGSPILVSKMGYTAETVHFGVDSAKTIQEEINSGLRPYGWNDPGNPAHQQWLNACAQRNTMQYQPGNTMFGYARIGVIPQGAQVMTNEAARAARANGTGYAQPQPAPQTYQGGPAPAATGGFQPQFNNQQPVQVHGQHMGYAPQQQMTGGYGPGVGTSTVM